MVFISIGFYDSPWISYLVIPKTTLHIGVGAHIGTIGGRGSRGSLAPYFLFKPP